MEEDEQKVVQMAVDAYLGGAVVNFKEFIHRKQWDYFHQRTKNKNGKIQVFCPMPPDWPVDKGMEVEVLHVWLYKISRELKQIKKHSLRSITDRQNLLIMISSCHMVLGNTREKL